MRLRLTIGDQDVAATLEDNAAARDFASLLPLTLNTHDLLGREKPGQLPRALAIGDLDSVFTYEVGQIAYWPPNRDIAIFYADDGAAIPSPGLIPLGTVDRGLDIIAGAGDRFTMTIDPIQ